MAELRKAKGLTQEDLVTKCSINVRTLQRIEAGEVIPRSYTLRTILSVLEVDYADFTNQFNSSTETNKDIERTTKRETNPLGTLTEEWSFALYIALLIVFGFLIKFGMPWHCYILPVLVIYLISVKEQEVETN